MSSQTGKNILFLAMIFEGHIPAAIQVINDLIFLGHNVTCYTLDTFENRLKKTGAKIKPISVGTISLPKEAPPIAVYGMTIEIFYDLVLTDVQNSKEKYDYFFFDSFFDGTQMNKIFNIPELVGVYIFPVCQMNPFLKNTTENRMRSVYKLNKNII